MKAKQAHELLSEHTEKELYQAACVLYRKETDDRIALRSHGKTPTRGVVESVVEEMKGWFEKVAEGLTWENPQTPKDIIKWESSAVYVRYKVIDPEIMSYGRRTRLEVLRGSRLPLLEALTPDALDAVSGMMVAKAQQDVRDYLDLEQKKKEFAQQKGKPICPYGAEERFCPHQETYSMAAGLPRCVEDCVFICTIDKCIKKEESDGKD